MPILDTDRILNGTDVKQLIHGYETLRNQYSDELARDYRNYYIGKPLSFIMKNAKYIIPEPQFGLPFMRWIATAFPNPYSHIESLKDCINGYLEDNRSKMHPGVVEMYDNAVCELGKILSGRSPEGATELSVVGDGVNEEFFDNCYAALCKERLNRSDEDTMRYFDGCSPYEGCTDFKSYLTTIPNMAKVVYLTPYAKELCLESEMCESYSSMIDTSDNGGKAKACNLVACERVQTLALSERFLESVNQFSNASLRALVNGMLRANIGEEIISAFKEATEDTVNPIYSDSKSGVNAILTESVFDELYKEDREKTREELLELKKTVYESVRETVHNHYIIMEETDIYPETELFTLIKESMNVEGPVTVDEAYKLITEAVSEVEANLHSFFEAVGDGSANKVIRKSHMMYREDDPRIKTQNKKEVTSKKSNSVDDDEEDIEDDNLEEDSEQELPKSTRVASSDLPDSSNPNAANRKPQKPKEGIITKIQNKAMDAHKESKKKGAVLRKAGTGIKNAGKAVLKIPEGLIDGFKSIIRGFDAMDDNRRKEYMLQPGYRKKVLKNLRVAATYGLAGYTHALLVPVVWFGRKLSKEKNKRIRNEFARELDTEIKVCEAKIEDATADGNQKQKYQLIRLRDELARQKERVTTNGKYI